MPPPQKSRSVLDRKMAFVELMHNYYYYFFDDGGGSPSLYPSSQHPAPRTSASELLYQGVELP